MGIAETDKRTCNMTATTKPVTLINVEQSEKNSDEMRFKVFVKSYKIVFCRLQLRNQDSKNKLRK